MMMEFYVTVIISGRGRGSVLQVSLVSAHRVLPGTSISRAKSLLPGQISHELRQKEREQLERQCLCSSAHSVKFLGFQCLRDSVHL